MLTKALDDILRSLNGCLQALVGLARIPHDSLNLSNMLCKSQASSEILKNSK